MTIWGIYSRGIFFHTLILCEIPLWVNQACSAYFYGVFVVAGKNAEIYSRLIICGKIMVLLVDMNISFGRAEAAAKGIGI